MASDWKVFLLRLAEEITNEDLETLKFLCQDCISGRKLDGISSAEELFTAIERIHAGPEKLDFLKMLFGQAKRIDLQVKIEQFQQGKSQLVLNNNNIIIIIIIIIGKLEIQCICLIFEISSYPVICSQSPQTFSE